ncbi:hypothetical protein ACIBI4_29650 [Streptomyces sp. NPDC050418]|uniref:hypothetical protein n=1 Tax=Streptomyces sp. NPDC050418 TaxID=3365612 RepID=UPI0037BD5055
MRTLIRNGLVAATAVAASFGLAATSASATSLAPWTVTGNTNPDGRYTASAGLTTLTNVNTDAALQCSSATAEGELPNGTRTTDQVATIDGSTWTNCSGPAGITFSVSHVGAWEINALSTNASGGVDGNITNISANISGPLCSASVSGAVPATYDNAGHLIVHPDAASTSKLTISNVVGCFGLMNNGDQVVFDGTYNVAPDTIRITAG